MTTLSAAAQMGKATTIKKTFSRQTYVSIDIDADVSIIWTLLTNASDYSRWNSTVTSLEGDIRLGEKIRLRSYLDDKRTFKLKVKALNPEKGMTWGDGKGNRIFTLTSNKKGGITFTMDETMGGFMFPMYSKYIPQFDESFEKFAADLKKEAELIAENNN